MDKSPYASMSYYMLLPYDLTPLFKELNEELEAEEIEKINRELQERIDND